MARCPFAKWRPLPENATAPRIVPKQFILHTAVDAPGSTDLYRFFARGDVSVESHFWVRFDGTLEQFMDTEVRADANRNANSTAISVETEDDGRPHQIAWTPQQLATLSRLARWVRDQHGIPMRRCTSPTGAGVGYHAMWGAPSPWTPAAGKTCPGVTRIAQIDSIIHAANVGVLPEAVKLGDRLLQLTSPFTRGPDVEALQVALTASGFPVDKDGVFGPGTDAAVRALQARHGLVVDGVVGERTLRIFQDRDTWVVGSIRQKWLEGRGALGVPITAELPCPDGRGRFNHFEAGSIYWTPERGAWTVLGEIREAWKSLGWERGELGYPVGDEHGSSFAGWEREQHFERGILLWNPGRVWSYREVWRAS